MKNLKMLFLLVFVITFSVHAEDEKGAVPSSKQQWLTFSGTNYCKPGFCLENVPKLALQKAFAFYKNHSSIIDNNDYIGVIDFSIKSTQKRFFIINLKTGAVESMLVTHGKKSETDLGVAGNFSNEDGSEMSSLGFYLTDDEPYVGKHGKSLRLDGLSLTNSNARRRNIVLHAADYATQWFADQKGRLGLSQGCPAVAPNKIEGVIKKLQGKGLLYIHKNN